MHATRHTNMANKDKRQTAAETLKEAEAARDDLNTALRSAGIVLPSLTVEAAAYGDKTPQPLLELGRCNIQMARKLTAALRREAH